MWGVVKNEVFSQKPNDLNHVKELIEKPFKNWMKTKNLCQAIFETVETECNLCIAYKGSQFEQI
jgi:hypothetical protein